MLRKQANEMTRQKYQNVDLDCSTQYPKRAHGRMGTTEDISPGQDLTFRQP